MKKRITGVALVLALALTATGFAQGGPPAPDGCTFERGVTTCAVRGPTYDPDTDIILEVGDSFCTESGSEIVVLAGSAIVLGQYDLTTTEYFGVSHVIRSQETTVFYGGLDFLEIDTVVGEQESDNCP